MYKLIFILLNKIYIRNVTSSTEVIVKSNVRHYWHLVGILFSLETQQWTMSIQSICDIKPAILHSMCKWMQIRRKHVPSTFLPREDWTLPRSTTKIQRPTLKVRNIRNTLSLYEILTKFTSLFGIRLLPHQI